jgi:uncharacterized membrane protein
MSNQVNTELTSDDKLWAFLAYLPIVGWIIAIVALLMEDKKARPYIKFHSIQGLILALINGIIAGVLAVVIVGMCTGIAGAIYMLYVGWKAYQGQPVSVPFVTDFIKKQGWA